MLKLDWIKDLKIEEIAELPEAYQTIASVIGIESTIKLAETFGGTSFYFQKLDKLLISMRDKRIKKEFTGFNHKQLATKYGLTEVWIRQIISGGDDRQESLF